MTESSTSRTSHDNNKRLGVSIVRLILVWCIFGFESWFSHFTWHLLSAFTCHISHTRHTLWSERKWPTRENASYQCCVLWCCYHICSVHCNCRWIHKSWSRKCSLNVTAFTTCRTQHSNACRQSDGNHRDSWYTWRVRLIRFGCFVCDGSDYFVLALQDLS